MLDQCSEEKHDNGDQWHTYIRVQFKGGGKNIGQVHPYHQHFAMTEVYDLHHAENNVLSHSHQGIETTHQQTVDTSLQENFQDGGPPYMNLK